MNVEYSRVAKKNDKIMEVLGFQWNFIICVNPKRFKIPFFGSQRGLSVGNYSTLTENKIKEVKKPQDF